MDLFGSIKITKNTMNNIEKLSSVINEITIDFVKYMFPDYEDPYFYWIWWDNLWTLEINDTYWNLSNIYEVLKNNYDKDKVFAWYDYITYYSSKDSNIWREYYINMSTFMQLYDWTEVKDFAKQYHERLDKQRKYWNSPEWKKETAKQMEELKEKLLKDYNL